MHEKELFRGLTTQEAKQRIEKFGLNEITEKKKVSAIKILLQQFNDFIIWVLIGATIISGLMGDVADAITIFVIVVINGILGFVQEFKTEKSLDALKSLAAPTCKVLRDGNIKVINANELTIGDVVILEAGDRVTADGEIFECTNFMIDESLLTGESVGVNKTNNSKEASLIYMGTKVLKGKGRFRVTAIGMSTKMGSIADMLQDIEEEKSPLKERLDGLGKILLVLCLAICALVTILGIIRGNDLTEMFLLGVSLAVAAIPEGLAAIVTVSLALGVSRMLKRNALVKKLPAVETLGCTSVICSDKTGTLTQNKMTVKEIFVDGKHCRLDVDKIPNSPILMKAFVYCNDCNYDFSKDKLDDVLNGDPTETALIKAYFNNVDVLKNTVSNVNRVFDIPFDSSRKMMSVIVKENGREACYVKGAPERLINKCRYIHEEGRVKLLTSQKKQQILNVVENMSNRALRCIGGAYRVDNLTRSESLENELIFLGIAGIIDPPRPEVKDSVIKCRLAGITPVMITGDHKNTAFAIGKDLNIAKSQDQVITGEELDKLDDKELKKRVNNGELPNVSIVDMREELKSNNKTMFSRDLYLKIKDRLEKKEQIILFLNRRGFSSFVSCRSCVFVFKCNNCDISMTYHNNGYLVCHYCGNTEKMPKLCPKCGSNYVKHFGVGTEKLEKAVHHYFKEAKVLRMDVDTTRKKNSHEEIYNSFKSKEADILIGTQMIAKGLDFPDVTLV